MSETRSPYDCGARPTIPAKPKPKRRPGSPYDAGRSNEEKVRPKGEPYFCGAYSTQT